MKHPLLLSWVLFLLTNHYSFSHQIISNDFSLIRKQIFDIVQNNVNIVALDTQVAELTASLSPDGFFTDINYTDQSQSNWQTNEHFSRMATLAKAYSQQQSTYYNSPTLLTSIVNLMTFWTNQSSPAVSSNWYYYSISVPKSIGYTLICMRHAPTGLTATLEQDMIQWMLKGIPIDQAPSNEGANLVDVATHYIIRASLLEDTVLMQQVSDILLEAIHLTTGEGIQADYSFRAHGPQLYMYGYGSDFLAGMTTIIRFVKGTSFQIPHTKIALLSNFIRHGFIQSSRGQYIDFNVLNRYISRTNVGKAESWQVEQFATIDAATHKEYYKEVVNRMKGNSNPYSDSTPRNIHYWRADYTVHHRPQFMMGIRSVSSITAKSESGNGEGLKSYYLTDGVNYIATNGNEYHEIFPVWNWSKLPGTTLPETTTYPLRKSWGVNTGTTDFVGATSDGLYGVHTYAMDDYNLQAKKAWFLFDHEVVCLGAGITSTSSSQINTTLNQSVLDGPVTVKANNTTQTYHGNSTQEILHNPQWVYHDSIAYFFPTNTSVHI